jgi:hypothetical protein
VLLLTATHVACGPTHKAALCELFRARDAFCFAGLAREAAALQKLSMLHVYGDPLKYRDLETKIEVERYNTAIVLCDLSWVDPDQVLPCSLVPCLSERNLKASTSFKFRTGILSLGL